MDLPFQASEMTATSPVDGWTVGAGKVRLMRTPSTATSNSVVFLEDAQSGARAAAIELTICPQSSAQLVDMLNRQNIDAVVHSDVLVLFADRLNGELITPEYMVALMDESKWPTPAMKQRANVLRNSLNNNWANDYKNTFSGRK